MKVVFPSSIPVWKSETENGPFVSFESSRALSRFGTKVVESGSRAIHFGGILPGVQSVVTSISDIDAGASGVVLPCPESMSLADIDMFGHGWSTGYETVANDPRIEVIAIAPGPANLSRFLFIRELVENNLLSDKVHWLYGVDNPAELVLYPKVFGQYVLRRFELAVCSMCFVYSVFGVRLSPSFGYGLPLPGVDVVDRDDLGMSKWSGYRMNWDQAHTFRTNMEVVRSFAEGNGGEEFVRSIGYFPDDSEVTDA